MNFARLSVVLAVAVLTAPCVQPAAAQWSDDPMVNLAIADAQSAQVLPKIAVTPDGGCYIGWFDSDAGNFDVRLQRLDRNGVEQWPHNGVLISDHPSMSFIVDWDLIADSDGGAVLAFADIRAGGDLDVYAYRIGPNAAFLWGPDGIGLSANNDFEPAPRVTETSDGHFVFIWPRLPDNGDGKIMLQRVTPTGAVQFVEGGLEIAGDPGESPAFADVIPAADGGVIVMWVRDISSFLSPRHIRAQRISATGEALWGVGPVIVFDATSVPVAYTPVVQPDGNGGALFAWHRSSNNQFDSFVQHLDADGMERFPHNGVSASTLPNRHKIGPSLSYSPATGDMLVFWNERNPNQSMWGISGQKISFDGERLWTDHGVALVPVNGVFKTSPRSVPVQDGAMVFYFDEPQGFLSDRVMAMRVDGDGGLVWDGSPLPACSLQSGKDDLVVVLDDQDVAKMAWEDERNDDGDIYAQNVNPDGSLGLGALTGDFDGDGDVDLTDVETFQSCVSGPGGGVDPGCQPGDADHDNDVDFADFAALQISFTG